MTLNQILKNIDEVDKGRVGGTRNKEKAEIEESIENTELKNRLIKIIKNVVIKISDMRRLASLYAHHYLNE